MDKSVAPDIDPDDRSNMFAAPSGTERESVSHDRPAKTAYYNYASEKSLTHEEAKLFFRRHQVEVSLQEAETRSPSSRAKASAPNEDGDGDEGLNWTASTVSRGDCQEYSQRDRIQLFGTAAPNSAISKPLAIKGSSTYGTEESSSFNTDHADEDEDAGDAGHQRGSRGDFANLALHGSDISPELSRISIKIKQVLSIRRKYISLSLQAPGENPKDSVDWTIYPPPPSPTWDDNKNRPVIQKYDSNHLGKSRLPAQDQDVSNNGSLSLYSRTGEWNQKPPETPTMRRRKQGHDIGEDFEMSELLPLPDLDENIDFKLDQNSVYQIFGSSSSQQPASMIKVPSLREFFMDMDEVQNVSSDGPTKSFAYRQLDILEGTFHLYFLVNSYQETADCKKVPHRDFYNVRKVDTHVHHSACMNQKHLLRFIKSKMKKSPDEIVMFRDGKHMTLKQVFESINLTAYDLSIDTLDMHVCLCS